MISRRVFVAGVSALSGCGPKLAKPFNGYALVANQGSRTVAVVNLTHFKVVKQIAMPGAPEAITSFAGGRRALVLLPEIGTVAEITADSLSVSRMEKLADRAVSMQVAADDGRAWLLTGEPQGLASIVLGTWKRDRVISFRYAPENFDISPDGLVAVVTHKERRQGSLISLRTGKATAEIELATEPGVVRFRPDGKQVLIGSPAGRTVTIADAISGRVLVILPVPFAPERFCFSVADKGGQMFATGRGMDAVGIIYPYQTELAETVLAGREPGAMAINNSLLFVTNPPTGDTTVLDIAERQVVARIASGQEPCAVTLTPDGEYALVLNRKSGDMAVVRISKFTDLRYKRAPLFNVIAVGDGPVAAAVVRL